MATLLAGLVMTLVLPQPTRVVPEARLRQFAAAAHTRLSATPSDATLARLAPKVRLRHARMSAVSALDASLGAAAAEFLNERLPSEMAKWVLKYTDVGDKYRSKNFWSNGLWIVDGVVVQSIDASGMALSVTVLERGKTEPIVLSTRLPFSAPCETPDALRDELLRINSADGAGGAATGALGASGPAGDVMRASGTLLSLPGASDRYTLPRDLWLNTTPFPRGVRRMFYEDVTAAVLAAVADRSVPRRMKVVCTPPELNTEMDTYRVGTLLEVHTTRLYRYISLYIYMRECVCVCAPPPELCLSGLFDGARATHQYSHAAPYRCCASQLSRDMPPTGIHTLHPPVHWLGLTIPTGSL